jgi:small-conductance mechanosensitive channel
MRRRVVRAVLFVLLISAPGSPQSGPSDHDVIAFLNQAIQWYHQVSGTQQLANDSADVLYIDNLHQRGLEVLRNCFDFAHAVAVLRTPGTAEAPPTEANSENPPTVNPQNLAQLATKAQSQVKQSQEELDALEKQLPDATGKKLATLKAQIAETRSELELAQARSETLNGFVQFLSSTSSGNHAGLAAQIDDLERTVPEVRVSPVSANKKQVPVSEPAAAQPSTPVVIHKQESSGILGMIEESFGYNSKLGTQKDAIASTAALRDAMQKLRAPLAQELKATSQQGESLTEAPDLTDPNAVEQRAKQISSLTARFRQDSAAVVPLGKALILLDSVRGSLTEWRNDTEIAYRQALKRLGIRLLFLVIAIAAIFIASEVWRKATMRYVQDVRRRNQFMLLRRIAVTFAMFLIVVFMLVTEVGSIATFAGFITAGLAVALQTVILSVVAYFLLIGKWGIRVGDRVSISGVTGDVIDIGLVRMHLMEVDGNGGEEQPTGRVAVFSNAVMFQPAANFFKQIPGTSFTWHRVTLTLAPETDYRRAEKLLMDAVNKVFAEYQDDIKRQHAFMQQTLTVPVRVPQPQSRFRFTDGGFELVIRFPVPLENVSVIDDQITRALVQAIHDEPSLRLEKQGTPAIQPVPETPHMDKPA